MSHNTPELRCDSPPQKLEVGNLFAIDHLAGIHYAFAFTAHGTVEACDGLSTMGADLTIAIHPHLLFTSVDPMRREWATNMGTNRGARRVQLRSRYRSWSLRAVPAVHPSPVVLCYFAERHTVHPPCIRRSRSDMYSLVEDTVTRVTRVTRATRARKAARQCVRQ